jgi:hypothetical protein
MTPARTEGGGRGEPRQKAEPPALVAVVGFAGAG